MCNRRLSHRGTIVTYRLVARYVIRATRDPHVIMMTRTSPTGSRLVLCYLGAIQVLRNAFSGKFTPTHPLVTLITHLPNLTISQPQLHYVTLVAPYAYLLTLNIVSNTSNGISDYYQCYLNNQCNLLGQKTYFLKN